jgi:hypothetical protein
MIIKNEILNALIKAFDYNVCQEATTIQNEPGVAYEVDLNKDGDTLTIVIEKKELENKDKKEFEAWLDTVDDNMFQEALEKVQKITGIDAKQLDKDYNSNDYKGIINLFKKIIPQIAQEKINNLQRYL